MRGMTQAIDFAAIEKRGRANARMRDGRGA